jgi:Zn finger protein HypA/HybF involved in hydrogenase expression
VQYRAAAQCHAAFHHGAILEIEGADVTCKTCKVPMKEMKGHIFHKKRKWRCPKCAKVRMQTQK